MAESLIHWTFLSFILKYHHAHVLYWINKVNHGGPLLHFQASNWWKDERLGRTSSHLVVLNLAPLDWESSTLSSFTRVVKTLVTRLVKATVEFYPNQKLKNNWRWELDIPAPSTYMTCDFDSLTYFLVWDKIFPLKTWWWDLILVS